jgi:hypothetical protein
VKRTTGISEAVLAYLTANADTPIRTGQLMEAAPRGAARSSVLSAVRRIMDQFPRRLERKGTGVYVWRSTDIEPSESKVPDLLMLRVLSSREQAGTEIFLVYDEDRSRVFVLTPLERW